MSLSDQTERFNRFERRYQPSRFFLVEAAGYFTGVYFFSTLFLESEDKTGDRILATSPRGTRQPFAEAAELAAREARLRRYHAS